MMGPVLCTITLRVKIDGSVGDSSDWQGVPGLLRTYSLVYSSLDSFDQCLGFLF